MRRNVMPAVLLCLLTAVTAYGAEPILLEPAEGRAPTIDMISSSGAGASFLFELPELSVLERTVDGELFHFVSIPGGGFTGEEGEPAIPTFSKLIAVPEGAEVRVSTTVLMEEERSGLRLFPMPEEETGAFLFEEGAYASGGFDKIDLRASVGETAILRDFRIAPITFEPVQYNPSSGELKIARRMQVDIEFVGAASKSATVGNRSITPTSFHELYKHNVLNYTGQVEGQIVAPGTWLIICPNDAAVVDSLQELVDWRRRKGASVILATTGETGTTTTSIKNYIQGVYDDPAYSLEYVVLAGDVGGSYSIPTYYESLSGYGGEGDHPYTQLDGTDILADVNIGRLSFSSLNELKLIVNKILQYESSPDTGDATWYRRACLVGDPASSGLSCIIAQQWLAERLEPYDYDLIHLITTSNFVTQMDSTLDKGTTILGYRGWLGMSGWSNANSYSTSNGWKLPYAVIITCDTGSFASGTSRSEGFLRAGFSHNSPAGAIGSIGTATIGTHTRYNNACYYGTFRGLLQEGMTTMGSSLARGKLELYMNYIKAEPDKVTIWSYWNNLMGDPAVEVWTNYPERLFVAHDASVQLGETFTTVSVTEGVTPVKDAQVCLWKGDEVHVVRFTDSAGSVDIPISPTTTGAMMITVSKRNKDPYLANINVVANTDLVTHITAAVDDDGAGTSNGNDNGEINPSESIELAVELQNHGGTDHTNITGTLSSNDPFVTITDSDETYGSIDAGNTQWGGDDFDFSVDPGCPDGHVLAFDLAVDADLGSWASLIEKTVVSYALVQEDETIVDGGDGKLDPGETADLRVLLRNNGGFPGYNLTGTLVSESPYITVNDDQGDFGTAAIDGTAENTVDVFNVTADPSTYDGMLVSFSLYMMSGGGILDTVSVSFPIGSVSSVDPVGPDGYGYLAFDDIDVGYGEAPTYSWIELDPTYGGDGTEIVMSDTGEYQDETDVLEMPFTFQYYGESFDTASVCSNGWIAMGATDLVAYRNWTIPGAGGPRGMIAPFWDNLYQVAGSKVFQKYDSVNHTWIVEWSRFRNFYDGSTVTFEAILYDPAFYTTDSGDGLIRFQYSQISNPDPVNGYATVGIESPDQMNGLLITYFNKYASGAATLAAGNAIEFVPIATGPLGTVSGHTYNASNGNSPASGVSVEVLGAGRTFISGGDGSYSGLVTPGTYTLVTSGGGFAPDTASGVTIVEASTTVQDFYLTDNAPPLLSTITQPSTTDSSGPYPINVTIVEGSGLAEKTLYYRRNWGGYQAIPLVSQGGDDYLGEIPGQPYTSVVEYYVYARDTGGLEGYDPPGGSASPYNFVVGQMETFFDDDAESDLGWTLGDTGDDATTGIWVRAEPVGTYNGGPEIQPEYDHTTDPAEICFVTGNANPGDGYGTNDVDNGKTTLLSPVFNLSDFTTVQVSYWVWYSNDQGSSGGDTWLVEVNDGGALWPDLENTTTSTNAWVNRTFLVEDYVSLTSQVQFRFVASDVGSGSIVEAGIDDFLLTGINPVATDVVAGESVGRIDFGLAPCRPNPFNPTTLISYSLPKAGQAELRIFDVTGREVSTLASRPHEAGEHQVEWNGTSSSGHPVAAGVYFVRLEAEGFLQVRQMTLIR